MNKSKFFKMFGKFTIILLAIVAVLFAMVFFTLLSGFNGAVDSESLDAYEGGRKNILVMGTDESGLRADVLLIASFPDGKGPVNVTSVPRDTRVQTTNGGQKINAALSIGGADYSVEKVREATGIKIHDYIKVNFNAVGDIVDKLGGVKFNVPQDMDYDDPYQNLSIHLKAGEQKLNGDQALQLLRFRRYPMGDIQRTKVQRDFINAVFDQKANIITVFKVPSIMSAISKNMETTVSAFEVLSYATMVKIGSSGGFQSIELPYSLGGNYVYLDTSGVESIVAEHFE